MTSSFTFSAPSWSSYQYGGPNLPQQRPLPQQQLLKPVDPVHHTAPEMGAKKNETEGNVVLNCGSSDSDTASTADAAQEPGATGKKKTPMCLVNELARHHKVFHEIWFPYYGFCFLTMNTPAVTTPVQTYWRNGTSPSKVFHRQLDTR